MHEDRETLIQHVFSTLELARRSMHAQFHQYVDDARLGMPHVRLLFLVERLQSVQPKELASKTYLTPGAITQTIESMVQDGYLTRRQDPSDRRSIFISLTDKGTLSLTTIKNLQQAHFTKMVSALTDEELRTFLHIQQKLLEYMERDDTEIKHGGEIQHAKN